MKKKASEEKRAAARADRRELLEKFKRLTDGERAAYDLAGYTLQTVDGHLLSPRNRYMCMIQAGGAFAPSVVGGFKQWRDRGRIVRKGSRALWISWPRFDKSQKEEDGSGEGEGGEALRGFAWAPVFDISQTAEAKPEEKAAKHKNSKTTKPEARQEPEEPEKSQNAAPVVDSATPTEPQSAAPAPSDFSSILSAFKNAK